MVAINVSVSIVIILIFSLPNIRIFVATSFGRASRAHAFPRTARLLCGDGYQPQGHCLLPRPLPHALRALCSQRPQVFLASTRRGEGVPDSRVILTRLRRQCFLLVVTSVENHKRNCFKTSSKVPLINTVHNAPETQGVQTTSQFPTKPEN